jgi:catechol-2,3-dioxygenase
MRIQELSLHTRHLADQKEFYYTALGLPLVEETTASFTLQAGTTRLRFQEAQQDVLYHVAFTIPRNTFTEAKSWLRKRVSLLRKHSEDEFFFATLNARSLYFCDAANNILELIVHYDLHHETEEPFGPAQVLHVSEVGLPVEDVPAQVSLLREKLAIAPYGGLVSEEFAFMGDIYGQLVVVKIGRPWQPAETLLAAVSPMQLTMSGKPEQQLQLSAFPYTITVVL